MKIKKHKLLLPGLVIAALGVSVLMVLTSNSYYLSTSLLLKILLVFSLIYLLFTFLHHHKEGTFVWEVMLEYILIACLSLAVLAGQFF